MKSLTICLFAFWIPWNSAIGADTPCGGEYPIPTWTLVISSSQVATSKRKATALLQTELREKRDEQRRICVANKGEAFWYVPTEVSCQLEEGLYRCYGSEELLCEAEDF